MVLGLLNQLMIVGELWTAGASHAGDSFSLSLDDTVTAQHYYRIQNTEPGKFGRQGATGVPPFTTCRQWDSVTVAGLGRAPIPENISGRKLTQVLNSVGSVLVHQETPDWGGV